jgi:VWFA-related protein
MKHLLPALWLVSSFAALASDAPSVTVRPPADADLLEGHVTLQAEVQPPPGASVESVSFRVDGRVIGEDAAPPYETEWVDVDTRRDHLIRATAAFSDGTRAYDLLSIPVLGMVTRATVLGDAPDQVLIAVTFLDADGQPITDVKQEELRVTENGRRQEITLLQPDSRPMAVQLLLDASHSTRPYWEDLARSTRLFAETLRPGDRAGVEAFNNKSYELAPLGSPASQIENATSRFADWGGGTLLYDVLARSALLTVGQEEAGRRAVVLLTDADDFGSVLSVDDALNYLVHTDVQLNTVVWFPDNRLGIQSARRYSEVAQRHRAMERVVHGTGGVQMQYGDVPLEEAFLRIGERLRSQYVLGYTSFSRREPGREREIQIRLRRSGVHRIRYRQQHFGGQSLEEFLAYQIREGSEERRLVAMQTAVRHPEPVILEALVDSLSEGSDVTSGLALEARLILLHLGPVAVPYLRDRLEDEDLEVSERAAQVLADLAVVLYRMSNTAGLEEALTLLGGGDETRGRSMLRSFLDRDLLPETRTALTELLNGWEQEVS